MKYYKQASLLLTGTMMWFNTVLAGDDAVFLTLPEAQDTIEIEFGDRSRIIIQVERPEDLELLRQYDINKMLGDLQRSVEETGDSTEVLIIEHPDGSRYEYDDEDPEFRELEEMFSGSQQKPDAGSDEVASKSTVQEESYKAGTWYSGSRTKFNHFFDVGMNNYTENGTFPDANDAQYTVKPWGSWYIALQPGGQTHLTGKLAVQYGGGVSWYNFKFQDASTRLIQGEEGVVFDRWDPALKASKSKLTVAHLNAYLVPVFDFGYRKRVRVLDDGSISRRIRHGNRGFRIGAGGYIGYRIGSYTKLVNRANGSKDKSRERSGYYLENLRYGARVVVGVGEVDFFVNYDLNNLFAPDRGPELNAFSFGLSF